MFASTADSAASNVREDNMRVARTNSLRMSIIIISAFIICWTPYAVLIVVAQIDEKIIYSWPRYTLSILFIWAFSSSLINPFIHSGQYFGCDYLVHVRESQREGTPDRPVDASVIRNNNNVPINGSQETSC